MTQLAMQRDDAAELEAIWTGLGPLEACRRLGVELDSKRSKPREAFIRCPWHAEKTASCTVRVGNRGTLQFRCFGGCGRSWDIHAAVAQLNALDPAQDFRKVLELSAELLGIRLDDAAPSAKPVARPRPAPAPEPPRWPPQDEVQALWDACIPITEAAEVWDWLSRIRHFGDRLTHSVFARDLARALPQGLELPSWARFDSGKNWWDLNFRLIVPLFDATGALRSVKARRIVSGGTAKVVPPKGYTPSGLVMADPLAREALLTGTVPDYFVPRGGAFTCSITEGETDYLARAVLVWSEGTYDPWAVFGVFSGSWSQDIAARIPSGSTVVIETDHDPTGDKYAIEIARTLKGRAALLRGAQ